MKSGKQVESIETLFEIKPMALKDPYALRYMALYYSGTNQEIEA